MASVSAPPFLVPGPASWRKRPTRKPLGPHESSGSRPLREYRGARTCPHITLPPRQCKSPRGNPVPVETNTNRRNCFGSLPVILYCPYAIGPLGGIDGLLVCLGLPVYLPGPAFPEACLVTASTPSILGLFLEGLALFTAFAFRLPPGNRARHCSGGRIPGFRGDGSRVVVDLRSAPGPAVSRESRLVRRSRTGSRRALRPGPPSNLCLVTGGAALHSAAAHALAVGPVSLAVFLAGTEIRVRTEDRLLASRFHQRFIRKTAVDPQHGRQVCDLSGVSTAAQPRRSREVTHLCLSLIHI